MTTYNIDAAHSEITFKIKHLMITNVNGRFTKFEGKMVTENDSFENADIDFEADIDSINTNNEQRDGHLRTGDFFDAAQYPKLTFKSTSFEKQSDEIYKLNGNLTLHGVTKPITMSAEFGGASTDFYGNAKIGFELTGSLKRKDYGLEWNAALETGGVALSDEVKLMLDIQMIKQA
jgi:polyisoprenoid-binding protein YceI